MTVLSVRDITCGYKGAFMDNAVLCCVPFAAVTLLIWRQEVQLACKKTAPVRVFIMFRFNPPRYFSAV